MSEIAIVKVRSAHDLEWHPTEPFRRILRLVNRNGLADRVEGTLGQAFMPQLTLPYLAGMGRAYNDKYHTDHSFTTIDEREENLDLEGFDLVLFTAMTPQAPATYRVADRVRSRGVPVVIGGIHPSTLPKEAAPHATSVVTGEAEMTLFEVLRDFDGRRLRPLYQGGRAACLGGLSFPDWRASQRQDYCPWVVPVQTSRGCRNACHFCSTTRFQGASRRHRPIEEIVGEIHRLMDLGVVTREKQVFFTDNNIVSDSDHRRGTRDTAYARALFEALIPLGIHWTGQGEIGVGEDPELVSLMAEAGCTQLLIGLESINQRSFSGLGKRSNTVESYASSLETLHRHGIANIGCFIFGLDEDTPDVFEATTAFISRYVDIPQLSLLTPYPGTALYRQMEREGRLLHRDWSCYDITHVVFQPRAQSPEELERRYAAMNHELFTYPAMLRRALRHALRRTVSGCSRTDRFTSTLAPNLVYRGLGRINRGGGEAAIWRDPELRPALEDLATLGDLAALGTRLPAERSPLPGPALLAAMLDSDTRARRERPGSDLRAE
ncbi:MAG: radical SAM protein, partial [Polyangia bacterium]|jgi:radical SAM superfamily enzyme YgiQ (UPF0313 family)|nr:radical SAM protein [Polyangia bacterium]